MPCASFRRPSRLSQSRLRPNGPSSAKQHELPEAATIWIYPGDLEFGGGAEDRTGGLRSIEPIRLDASDGLPPEDAASGRRALQASSQSEAMGYRFSDRLARRNAAHPRASSALSDFVVMVNPAAYAKMDYPLVALESMCLARPVLVAKGTPSAELSEGGGAVDVETSGEALAEAIERLSADQAATDAVGRKARALVTSKFSPQAVAEAYEVLYEDIHGVRVRSTRRGNTTTTSVNRTNESEATAIIE